MLGFAGMGGMWEIERDRKRGGMWELEREMGERGGMWEIGREGECESYKERWGERGGMWEIGRERGEYESYKER